MANTTESHNQRAKRLADEIEVIREEIGEKQKEINTYHFKLFKDTAENQEQGIEAEIAIKTQIGTAQKEIATYHGELIENDDSLKEEIEAVSDEIKEYHAELFKGGDDEEKKAIKSQIDESFKKIQSYRIKLFVDKEDGTKSVWAQIEMLMRRIKIHHNEVSKLKKTVKELLSGATAGVLASAYRASKERYGPVGANDEGQKTSKDGEENPSENKQQSFGNLLKIDVSAFGYYILFLGPLILVSFIFYPLFDPAFLEKEIPASQIISRILITAPLAAISFFGWSSIQFRRKMYEWYNHKQRVVQMYQGFKDEIGKEGGPKEEEAIKNLLEVVVDTVNKLPPSRLSKPSSRGNNSK